MLWDLYVQELEHQVGVEPAQVHTQLFRGALACEILQLSYKESFVTVGRLA
jgi:hypothetical protein